jgi:hypothetical protein
VNASSNSTELAAGFDLAATPVPVTIYSQPVENLLPGDRIETLSEVEAETVHDRAAVHSQLVLADGPTATTGTPLQPDNLTEINPWMASLPIHDSALWTVPAGIVGDRYVNLVMWGEPLQSTATPADDSIAIAPDGGQLVVRQIRPVDTVAPHASISSGPAGLIASPTASFAFSLDETLSTAECRLDPGGSFQPCSSPLTYSGVGDGPHTFSVRGTDRAGNIGSAATRSFTVDSRPPIVSITRAPTGKTRSKRVRISFAADESGVSFACRIDGRAQQPCASPVILKARRGRHTFEVQASDRAGNTGPLASRRWKVVRRKG